MKGLYVHVPFCAKKCHYCNFVIAPASSSQGRSAFFEALEREAARAAELSRGAEFDTVYLGGGTPSVLDAAEFERLFRILRSHFSWKRGAEVTCEANPGDVDPGKASHLKELG